MPVEKVREVAFEIGMVGRNGLDYASPDKKYALKSLPDEQFSGLRLMCLMFAGFKRIAPEHDLRMDLNEPFLTALEMFQQGEFGVVNHYPAGMQKMSKILVGLADKMLAHSSEKMSVERQHRGMGARTDEHSRP